MLAGKRYRLENPTLALDVIDGKRTAITIPTGAIIKVISDPSQHGEPETATVLWESRTLTMFAIDIEVRGTEIAERGANA